MVFSPYINNFIRGYLYPLLPCEYKHPNYLQRPLGLGPRFENLHGQLYGACLLRNTHSRPTILEQMLLLFLAFLHSHSCSQMHVELGWLSGLFHLNNVCADKWTLISQQMCGMRCPLKPNEAWILMYSAIHKINHKTCQRKIHSELVLPYQWATNNLFGEYSVKVWKLNSRLVLLCHRNRIWKAVLCRWQKSLFFQLIQIGVLFIIIPDII